MRVRELIRQLQRFDEDLNVFIPSDVEGIWLDMDQAVLACTREDGVVTEIGVLLRDEQPKPKG